MAESLDSYLDHVISVITCDGRHIVGILRGFDQTINLIIDESHERFYNGINSSIGVVQEVLGLYIIRGDNVALVGELDELIDSAIDLSAIKAEPLKPIIH